MHVGGLVYWEIFKTGGFGVKHEQFFNFMVNLCNRIDISKWVFIMDNAKSHKHPLLEIIYQNLNCRIWWLPPYSPDYNPIELCFGWVKGFMRKFFFLDLSVDEVLDCILRKYVRPEMLYNFVVKSVREWNKNKI